MRHSLLLAACLLSTALAAAACERRDAGTASAEHAPADTTAALRGVTLSVATGDGFDPARAGTAFPPGIRGVAARYRYEDAGVGSRFEFRWSFSGTPIFDQAEEVREPAGGGTWVLRMTGGEPLPEGPYGLDVLEDGRSVLGIPFTVGAGESGSPPPERAFGGGVEAAAAGDGAATDTAGAAVSGGAAPEEARGPGRKGDEEGEVVSGTLYRNPAIGLSFEVPSYAWRLEPAPRSEPGVTVAAARFSPQGRGLAVLRVRSAADAGDLEAWAAARRRQDAPAVGATANVKAETREISGRRFVQADWEEDGTRTRAAYTTEGGRGYAFVFRAPAAVFPALQEELASVLDSARFGMAGTLP